MGQQENVVFPLLERRQVDGNHAQPEEEILAELAFLHGQLEVLVRGRDHPHIHPDLLAAADPLDDLLLQEAQHLHLERQGQLADLVEKERPAVGQFEAPLALHVGPRVGPLLVTEELALQELLRDGPAVDDDEWPLAVLALPVDRLRDKLLPGPALARDQHGDVGRGHLPHRGKDLLHLRACPQHPLEVPLPRLQLKLGILPLERGDVQGPPQDRPSSLDVDRLVEDVVGPRPIPPSGRAPSRRGP